MGITFKEALENRLINKNILNILPHKCKCGSDLVISDSLKELKCINEECSNRLTERCMNFCEKAGLDISTEEMSNLIQKLEIVTPYQLMVIDKLVDNKVINNEDIHNIEHNIQIIKNIKQSEYFMYEIIEYSGIRNIMKIARRLFSGFNSMDEIFEELESSRIIFINERLGIQSSDSTIISVEIYNEIIGIKEELIFAETLFKAKIYDNVIKVAFADNAIGKFLNKSEVLEYMNNKYKVCFVHISSISDITDILVKSGNNTSSKVRIARAINERYIAENINNRIFKLCDIGKIKDNELKPIGSKVYIDSFDNIMQRLGELYD